MEPSSTATYFQLPSSLRWLMIVCLVALLGFMGLIAAVAASEPRWSGVIAWGLCAVPFGVLAFLFIGNISKSWDRVAADETGVWYFPRKGPCTLIKWDEIANVEARDITLRLVVGDSSGLKKINLDYHLENFDKLRDIVLTRTQHRRNQAPLRTVFFRNYKNRGILSVFFAFFLGVGLFILRTGQVGASLLMFGLAATPFFMLRREPSKITISPLSFRIDYLGWHRTISFQDVSNIEMVTLPFHSDVFQPVMVTTKTARPIMLTGFREGTLALCDSLRRMWLASRGETDVSPPVQTAPRPDAAVVGREFQGPPAPRTVFRGRLWFVLFPEGLIILNIFFLMLFWNLPKLSDRRALVTALCLPGIATGFYLLMIAPRRVKVGSDSVIIEYVWRRRNVPYSDIADISVDRRWTAEGTALDVVRLEVRNGGRVNLGGFGQDSSTLYDALRTAWLRARDDRFLTDR